MPKASPDNENEMEADTHPVKGSSIKDSPIVLGRLSRKNFMKEWTA